MKALTLWRPWPAAIIHSTKRVEVGDVSLDCYLIPLGGR